MTANQISYANYLEDKRHNLAQESETNRSNLSNEEIKRSDISQRAYDNAQTRELTAQQNALSRELTARQIDDAIRQTDIKEWDTGYYYLGPNSSNGLFAGVGSAASKTKPFFDILKSVYTMIN